MKTNFTGTEKKTETIILHTGGGAMKIFSYEWADIQRAQQGGSLSRPVGGRSASVQCFRCEKFFRLPIQAPGVDPFPVQCAHCGYAHTTHDAKSANWPTI